MQCLNYFNYMRYTFFLFIAFACLLGFASSTQLEAQSPVSSSRLLEVPPIEPEDLQAIPKNLARWNMGLRLLEVSSNPDFEPLDPVTRRGKPEGSLFSDDETAAYTLPAGKTVLVLDLGDFYIVEEAGLLLEGAGGSFGLRASSTPPPDAVWQDLVTSGDVSPSRPASFAFAPVEARYLEITVNSSGPAGLAGLTITGEMSAAEVSYDPRETGADSADSTSVSIEFDFASLYTGTQVVYVSSGEVKDAQRAIDDSIFSPFPFEAANAEAVMIIDLGASSSIYQINVISSAQPGTISVYAFPALPEVLRNPASEAPSAGGAAGSTPPIVDLPDGFFDEISPLRVIETDGTTLRNSVSFPETSLRYVLLRWANPEPLPEGLQVFEVGVIGRVPFQDSLLVQLPEFEFAAVPPIIPTAPTIPPEVPQLPVVSQ